MQPRSNMMRNNLFARVKKITLAISWMLLVLNILPTWADEYVTGVGGQRGTAPGQKLGPCPDLEPSLTALVVPSKVAKGVVSREQQTFWFYVPYQSRSIKTAVFQLSNQGSGASSPVYSQSLKRDLAQATVPGVIAVSVPSTVLLEDGKQYQLSLSVEVYCTPTSRPQKEVVVAWVKVKGASPTLKNQLRNATPQQRALLYEQNGFWYDALTAAVEAKKKNPNDKNWAGLLRFVKLDTVASKRIINCCGSADR